MLKYNYIKKLRLNITNFYKKKLNKYNNIFY